MTERGFASRLQEKVRGRRFAREGPSEKVHRRRGLQEKGCRIRFVREGLREKVRAGFKNSPSRV